MPNLFFVAVEISDVPVFDSPVMGTVINKVAHQTLGGVFLDTFLANPLNNYLDDTHHCTLLFYDPIKTKHIATIAAIKNKLMTDIAGKNVTVCVPVLNSGIYKLFGKSSDCMIFQKTSTPNGFDEISTRLMSHKELSETLAQGRIQLTSATDSAQRPQYNNGGPRI